ncbi:MAG: sel1 repeat family protein, partial [Sulfurimonas sp.]|nr:sel1 repeat family protein [Sulfurimonas sp.]
NFTKIVSAGLLVFSLAGCGGSSSNYSVKQHKLELKEELKNIATLSKPEQLELVKERGRLIAGIKNPDNELQLAAIKNMFGTANIQYINNPSIEAQKYVVQEHGTNIQYINNPSKEIQKYAVQNNGNNIRFIKNPSKEIQLISIKQQLPEMDNDLTKHGKIYGYVSDYLKELQLDNLFQLKLINTNCKFIRYIKNPSKEVQLIVIAKNPYLLKFIQNSDKDIELEQIKSFGWKIKGEKAIKLSDQSTYSANDLYNKGLKAYNKKDYKYAYIYSKVSALMGNGYAQNNIGSLLYSGKIMKGDKKRAFYWFEKAAKNGVPSAQNTLGTYYKSGEDIPKDFKKAYYWTKKSVDNGHAAAKQNLAVYYYNGIGTEKNISLAYKIWLEAVNKGDKKAQSNINVLCSEYPAICGHTIKKVAPAVKKQYVSEEDRLIGEIQDCKNNTSNYCQNIAYKLGRVYATGGSDYNRHQPCKRKASILAPYNLQGQFFSGCMSN